MSTVGKKQAMETSAVKNPSAATDSSRMAQPAAARSRLSQNFLDGDKAGAAMLFSGAFLALVGITFTTMGWKSDQTFSIILWSRMLGPMLICSGGAFILSSVFSYGVEACRSQGRKQDEMFVIPVKEQPSFVLHGMNQPVVLHDGATMVCVPPAYSFNSKGAGQAGSPVSDVAITLPPYDDVFSVDNAAEEGRKSSSVQKAEEESVGRCSSTCPQPPAYEDIYPSCLKPNSS